MASRRLSTRWWNMFAELACSQCLERSQRTRSDHLRGLDLFIATRRAGGLRMYAQAPDQMVHHWGARTPMPGPSSWVWNGPDACRSFDGDRAFRLLPITLNIGSSCFLSARRCRSGAAAAHFRNRTPVGAEMRVSWKGLRKRVVRHVRTGGTVHYSSCSKAHGLLVGACLSTRRSC